MGAEIINNFKDKKVWIFQSNPKYYRILDALCALDEILFMVSRYRSEIQKDDIVLLWISGKFAGIYAIGRVSDQIIERTSPERDGNFWVDPSAAQIPKPRVTIKILKRFLSNPILKKDIIKVDKLNNLSILKQPNATNFRVTEQEWQALSSLLPKAETISPQDDIKKWAAKQARGGKIYDESCGQILERYVQEHFEPGKEHSRDKIQAWFAENYPLFKPITVQCHIEKYTTNFRSRVHYNAGPEHDLLFRVDQDWSRLRLYRPDEDPPPIHKTTPSREPRAGGAKVKGKQSAGRRSLVERHRLLLEHLSRYG